MRVIRQDWKTKHHGTQPSISLDEDQLSGKIAEFAAPERCKPQGEVREARIPDDHILAEVVKSETVFLCEDEMGIIAYPK